MTTPTTSADPTDPDPDHYRVVFDNERVRVLEYIDAPGDATHDHEHPDSVMVTLTSFRRRLHHGERQREVEISSGFVGWVPAQRHRGQNVGDTPTHAIFVELKEGRPDAAADGPTGPH